MKDLPVFPIIKVKQLYAGGLGGAVDAAFARDPRLLAIGGRRSPFTPSGSKRIHLDLSGHITLSDGPDGPLLRDMKVPLLQDYPQAHHTHWYSLWFDHPTEANFLILMHREIVLVLPGDCQMRGCKSALERDGLAIMAEPTSSHDRMNYKRRFERISREAAGMLRYTWKDGITLRNLSGEHEPIDLVPAT